jgi:hypothetical protein
MAMLAPFLALLASMTAFRQISVSSRAFDPLVAGGRCGAAPPLQGAPTQAPLSPMPELPSEATLHGGEAAAMSGRAGCRPKLQWIIEGSSRHELRARLDVGGGGVPEGWMLRFDFGSNATMQASEIVGGHLLWQDAGIVAVLPRLASGLGTMMFTLARDDLLADDPLAGRDRGTPRQADRPTIMCVEQPSHDVEEEGAWKGSAHDDYLWMAKEFNRQYINSHGKEHHEYQPHSAANPRQLHYLNGRFRQLPSHLGSCHPNPQSRFVPARPCAP